MLHRDLSTIYAARERRRAQDSHAQFTHVSRVTRSSAPAIGGCGAGWKLRALVAEGTELDKRAQAIPEIECTPLAPFAPTALAKSLSGADALVVITAGAGGGGSRRVLHHPGRHGRGRIRELVKAGLAEVLSLRKGQSNFVDKHFR